MSTYTLITDTTKINKAIALIQSTGAKLDTLIHTCAMSVVAHVSEHRNTTLISQLIAAMPKSARRKNLINWFEVNSPVQIVEKSNGGVVVEIADLTDTLWIDFKAQLDVRLTTAHKTPFWELKMPQRAQEAPTLEAIIKYITKKMNDPKIDAVEKDKLTMLITLAATL